jgi:MFS family permease
MSYPSLPNPTAELLPIGAGPHHRAAGRRGLQAVQALPLPGKRPVWSGGGRLVAPFRALGQRNYGLFWSGQLVALTGAWMQRTAVAWVVLQLTDSALALGIVTMLQFLPLLLFALVGGVLADRLPKRQVLLVTQLGIAAQAVLLAVLVTSGAIQLWHLYLLSAALGVLHAVDNPTRGALTMELVGPNDQANAIALNSGNFNLARMLGPAAAGLLIATTGANLCFWLSALGCVLMIGSLLLMRAGEFHDVPAPARGSVGGQLVEGVAYAMRTPAVFGMLLVVATIGAFGFNFLTILPLLARYVFDAGPEAYGLLSAALGLGSLGAALAVATRQHASRRLALVAAVALAVLHGLIALSPWYVPTALLLIGLGAASIAFSATAQVLIQSAAPPELRGRMMGLYTVLFAGMTPLGAIVVGGLSESFSVQTALAVVAGLCMFGTLAGGLYLFRRLGPPAVAAAG